MSTTAPGNAEPQLGSKTPAPKVRPIPAQGSALGSRHAPTQALKIIRDRNNQNILAQANLL